MKCGYKWHAPYQLSPDTKEVQVGSYIIPVSHRELQTEQECVLPEGHDGVHRSRTNVTKEQTHAGT